MPARRHAQTQLGNPDTNQFEKLHEALSESKLHEKRGALLPGQLVRPNGSPVPEYWSIFTVGEEIPIKGHVFKVAYIGKTTLLLEPAGPIDDLQRKHRPEGP